jgi:hypothetical protein
LEVNNTDTISPQQVVIEERSLARWLARKLIWSIILLCVASAAVSKYVGFSTEQRLKAQNANLRFSNVSSSSGIFNTQLNFDVFYYSDITDKGVEDFTMSANIDFALWRYYISSIHYLYLKHVEKVDKPITKPNLIGFGKLMTDASKEAELKVIVEPSGTVRATGVTPRDFTIDEQFDAVIASEGSSLELVISSENSTEVSFVENKFLIITAEGQLKADRLVYQSSKFETPVFKLEGLLLKPVAADLGGLTSVGNYSPQITSDIEVKGLGLEDVVGLVSLGRELAGNQTSKFDKTKLRVKLQEKVSDLASRNLYLKGNVKVQLGENYSKYKANLGFDPVPDLKDYQQLLSGLNGTVVIDGRVQGIEKWSEFDENISNIVQNTQISGFTIPVVLPVGEEIIA